MKTIKLIGRGFILFSIVSSLFGICLLILGQPTFLGGHRVLIFNGLYQFADGTYPFYRISGLFDNANSAGIIALFGIIALDKNEHSDKSAKFFIIINILFIFLTGSRTVLILMVLYFILSKSRSVNVSSLLKIIAILVPLAFLIIHKFYSSGVDLNAYLDSRMNDGLSSRDIAWGYLYDWFVSNPFGIGLDYADYRLLNDVKLGFGSHSGHFALITEVGIVLYILLMSTLFFFGMKNFIRRKLIDNPYIVYIPLIIFVHQFIERGIFQITYHYYLLLIVLVLGLLKEKRNEYTSDYVS
ncbi:O-antigen ligase family protein [Vibrio breoganii]